MIKALEELGVKIKNQTEGMEIEGLCGKFHTKKADLLAYIKAWKVNLQTIKTITEL